MAQVSAFGFGGTDHLNTIFESANNYLWNSWAADDAADRAADAAILGYGLHMQSLRDSPLASVQGLEKAGLNPILAANSSAGAYSANVGVGSPLGDSGHGGSSSSGDPLQIAGRKAAIKQASSAADAQKALKRLYESQADRMRFIPLTESDSGGLNILGTGFNAGGTDTLLFDTKTGAVIRPKSQGAGGTSSSSELSKPASSSASQYSSQVEEALKKKGLSFKDLWNVE